MGELEVIRTEQAEALKSRYPAPGEAIAWSRIIFFCLGAVLFGLGVVLLFAYNWQQMHKFAKLGVILAALIGAHGAGRWLWRPPAATGPRARGFTCWAPCCSEPASG